MNETAELFESISQAESVDYTQILTEINDKLSVLTSLSGFLVDGLILLMASLFVVLLWKIISRSFFI